MVIFKEEDLKFYRSGTTGTGNCLGGAVNAEPLSESFHGLFNIISSMERHMGKTKYRCIYMKNTSAVKCLNPKLYIPQNTVSAGTELWFAFDKVNGVGNGTSSGVAQTLANESDTAPTGIIFKNGTEPSTGDALGADIAKNQMVAIWFRLNVKLHTEKTDLDGCIVYIETSNEKDVEGVVETPTDTTVGVIGESDVNEWFAKLLERLRLKSINWLDILGNVSTSTNPIPWFNMLGIFRGITAIAFGPLDNTNPQMKSQLISLLAPNLSSISRGYYSKIKNNLCEIFMDVTQPFENPSAQYDFIVATLTSARDNPKVDFIIVHCNKAFYATLASNDTSQQIDGRLRITYHKLFEDMGVHLVISGQFRNYQRQKVLSWNESAPDTPGEYTTGAPHYVISTGQKGFGPGIGCLFIIDGTGGRRPLHSFNTDKLYTAFKHSLTNNNSGGFLIIKSEMKRVNSITGAVIKPARLLGSYFEYYQPTWLESLLKIQPKEILRDQFSITIQDPVE
jgi:hypothetical protein